MVTLDAGEHFLAHQSKQLGTIFLHQLTQLLDKGLLDRI
jgi:hypothetical protein